MVLGEDGTVYVTTDKGLTAVTPDGAKKWFMPVSGDSYSVWGSPAVDNQGYIYFNESEVVDGAQTVAKLTKVKPDGTKASEVALGTSLRTSPTISPDGTIGHALRRAGFRHRSRRRLVAAGRQPAQVL